MLGEWGVAIHSPSFSNSCVSECNRYMVTLSLDKTANPHQGLQDCGALIQSYVKQYRVVL